ncbi:hypothetical protein SASPL_135769 [Salvia splendens]|uniref:Uncharacterized protein n=1 Tax=Salvia splendens TaxID=180675 RepID=A0A8X8WX23_SALSN|nr:hypothetical protein SASPL_135769 [Salvia splendens]
MLCYLHCFCVADYKLANPFRVRISSCAVLLKAFWSGCHYGDDGGDDPAAKFSSMVALHFWGTGSGALPLVSSLFLRDCCLRLGPDCLEDCIKALYMHFLASDDDEYGNACALLSDLKRRRKGCTDEDVPLNGSLEGDDGEPEEDKTIRNGAARNGNMARICTKERRGTRGLVYTLIEFE